MDATVMVKKEIIDIKRLQYATMLGFINTMEAVCCMGRRGFNDGFEQYQEFLMNNINDKRL